MLIRPWDAALDEQEWRDWLAQGHDFGLLAVNGAAGEPPVVVPTHFVLDGDVALIHVARPNPVAAAIAANPAVVLSVVDDEAYVPTTWRAKAGGRDEDGVPTSYYTAVQLHCRAGLVDDPGQKADLLRRQLAHFQPQGDHADVAVGQPPYGRMLAGIVGIRLVVEHVAAKFKYDDHNPEAHRATTADRLDARGSRHDAGAAVQQRRRLGRIGTWTPGS